MIKQMTTNYLMNIIESNQVDENLLNHVRESKLYKSFRNNKKSLFLPLFDGIAGATITLDIFWPLFMATTLSIMVMVAMTVVLAIAAMAFGAGLTWKFYRKRNKELKKLDDKLQEVICKEIIYEELLTRKRNTIVRKSSILLQKIIAISDESNLKNTIDEILASEGINSKSINDHSTLLQFGQNKKLQSKLVQLITSTSNPIAKTERTIQKKLADPQFKKFNSRSKKLNASVGGATILSILFGSFFVCSSYILPCVGLVAIASVLSNPISLAVALGVASLYGGYYAYATYRYAKRKHQIESVIDFKNQTNANHKYQLESFSTAICSLKKSEAAVDSYLTSRECSSSYKFFTTRKTGEQALKVAGFDPAIEEKVFTIAPPKLTSWV